MAAAGAAAATAAAAAAVADPDPHPIPPARAPPPPVTVSAVVFGAEAVRRGVDTLGLPPTAPAWWLTGADPLAAMLEDQRRLRSQIAQ